MRPSSSQSGYSGFDAREDALRNVARMLERLLKTSHKSRFPFSRDVAEKASSVKV